MTQQKPTALPVNFQAIPDELKALPQWLLWRYVPKQKPDGTIKWAKVPFQVNGQPAKSNDPSTWCSYDDAADGLLLGDFDGVGFAFADDDGLFGIDLDDCRDTVSGELTELAQEVLQKVDGYAEVSPSGTGIKLFTRGPLDRARKDDARGIELYPAGRYFTVTGHQLNGHEQLPTFDEDISWFVAKYFNDTIRVSNTTTPGDLGTALELYKPQLPDWDAERVQSELLPHLDPDSGYSAWVNVGMALHHQGAGDPEWLTLWDEWSQQSDKYVTGECEEKWASFNQQRASGTGAITLASLIKQANEARSAEEKALRRGAIDRWNQRIAAAPDVHELRDTVCAEIARDKALDDVSREMVAQQIKGRFRALGTALGIGAIRDLIRPAGGVERTVADIPGWLDGWVYVTREDKFMHVQTKRKVSMQGFCAMFNSECIAMGMGGDDGSVNAGRLALDHWDIATVDREVYLPGSGQFFEVDGLPCVNLYRPETVPVSKDEMFWDDEDLLAVNTVRAHLDLLCGNDSEITAKLIEWLAHNVQQPGKKIRWSPLIKGIEGDGKSAIGQLLQSTMGHENVTVVSPNVLMGQFNGWAEGHCVAVLEEVRIAGHNRHDALNAVKPIITNPITPIHRKGMDEYNIVNTTNIIGFTNHVDALPLDEGERRWMVIFTPFVRREQLNAATGPDYFRRLFDAIRGNAPALRGWLMSVDVDQGFPVNGPAPLTRAKEVMVSLGASADEQAARDAIEDGAIGVCEDVISSRHLSDTLRAEGVVLQTSSLNRLLVKMNYQQLDRIKWEGATCRVWVTGGSELSSLGKAERNKRMRERLDQTKQQAFMDDFLQ